MTKNFFVKVQLSKAAIFSCNTTTRILELERKHIKENMSVKFYKLNHKKVNHRDLNKYLSLQLKKIKIDIRGGKVTENKLHLHSL